MPQGVRVSREERRGFWAGIRGGLSPSQAAVEIGASGSAGRVWIVNAGGVLERISEPTGLRLDQAERKVIEKLVGKDWSLRAIADALDRNVSTVSREVTRNGGRRRYRCDSAQLRAERGALRPKATKLG